tara:strand:+ start:1921 stop:2868 length:948 start_codon:yes stop_codon:yes gene_type:complete
MRIAVLLCAQPRFLNLTYKRIKEEFNIPNVQVDFFIHFWNVVGFSPQCEKTKDYTTDDNLEKYIHYLEPKKYKIEDYSELDNLVFLFKNLNTFLVSDKILLKAVKDKYRYEFGQWFSNKRAYSLMEEYEQENNFKYDVVIRTKTDYIYSNSDKLDNYIIPEDKINTNFALVTNLKIRKFVQELNGFKNHQLKEYIPGVTLTGESIYENIRYDINTMSATRSAAYYLFNTWYQTYLRTLIFDSVNKLEKELESHKKQDVVWGNAAIYNNIHLVGKERRYIRLYLKDKCKKSWIDRKENTTIEVTGLTHHSELDSYV